MGKKIAKKLRKISMLLTLIAILGAASGCYPWLNKSYEVEKNYEWRSYTYNPTTIIDSLNQGNTDVFMLLRTTPEAIPAPLSVQVSWSETEFLRIAEALAVKSWEEPLGIQNLYHMAFKINCSDIEQRTFSEALFLFYKVSPAEKGETRVEYNIQIRPADGIAYTSRNEFTPNINAKKSINMTKYRISSEAALQIAENNGGNEKRSEYKNACFIDVLAPGPDGKGWRVIYINKNKTIESYFEIAIDPQTGVFKVLKTDP